ncbi:MAG: hypothetical protein H6548_05995 [Chitinophagales bacterium]|nr:hypothetical protein [Chitinophagales bacterium]MCB9020291.1 hypothetical protein [Chitinophagales bacterium]MCB9021650.1 hypothetical protein [Chitinophagales bacterium]MCB9031097.1 hypothetical protein [Chitinophagales bacterium]HPE98634.1 hypothetical protein [Chitinophagales bacterium]
MWRWMITGLLLFPAMVHAQLFTSYTGDGSPGEILTNFDQIPVFPGDQPELFNYFETNVYPNMPSRSQQDVNLAEGTGSFPEEKVVLAFDLNRYGEVSNRRIEYNSNLLMERSWQRALDKMPIWAPAICYGEPTDVQVYLPLRYVISDNQVVILGWGEWLYESSGRNLWLKVALGVAVLATFTYLLFGQ